MPDSVQKPAKTFTLEEANRTLPLVRAIAKDLSDLSRELIDRQQRLDLLRGDREHNREDPYLDELAQVETQLEQDAKRLEEYVEELRELGVEPKNAPQGLVDFPSMMEGRLVYLCWKLDEPEVLYWHEVDAGFAGRQPLGVESSP